VNDIVEFTRKGALLVARPERETLVVTGPERAGWLNGLVTCDVTQVAAGQGVHGLVLSKVGKIQSDLEVVAAGDRLLLSVASGTGRVLCQALDRMLVMEDAELADGSADWSWLGLHGGRALELAALLGEAIPSVCFGSVDWTGLGGAALVLPPSAFAGAAALARDLGWVRVARPLDWEVLRLECGYAEFGVDYGPAETPHDASLERRAVAWNKGCYLGQEVVCKQEARGQPRWRLERLSIEANEPPPRGSPVRAPGSGEPVGEVTSSAPSVTESRVVAMARLKTSFAREHGTLEVLGFRARVTGGPPGPAGSC
jgi:tRNA-modifying protein YgfZ